MMISEEHCTEVDWKIFMKTMSYLSPPQQLFIMKHCAGISAMGQNMLRKGERTISHCPWCNQVDEHGEHIVLCQGKSAQETFLTAFTELEFWLQRTTRPEIETAITDIIWAYRNELEIDPDKYDDTPVRAALREQINIGMYPFLCGFVSTKWAEVQQTHINEKASWRCRKKWTAQLCVTLIEIIHNMWTDRNDILHKNENMVKEEENKWVDRSIKDIYESMPSNTHILTAAEQQFFKGATCKAVQRRKVGRKNNGWKRPTASWHYCGNEQKMIQRSG